MKTIAIRDFQLKAHSHIKDLPITLTRYGKPIAVIEAYKPTVNTVKPINESTVNTNYVALDNTPFMNIRRGDILPAPTVKYVKCIMPNCRENATAIGKIYSEVDGDIVDAQMCPKHALASLKERIK
jgi:hypothetical protein